MKRRCTTLAGICCTLVTFQALAVVPARGVSARRQLMACMTKHMAASRTLSYNAATTLCKEELKAKDATLAAAAAHPASGMGH